MSGGWARPSASASARGYGASHVSQRAQLAPIVAAGKALCAETVCLMPTRRIDPGEPWDLAHAVDRGSWLGPSHKICNANEASRRGGITSGQQAKRRAALKYRKPEVHPGLL